jgi:glycerophosphoryl diester phosphodiesterase
MKCISAYGLSTQTVPTSTNESALLSIKPDYLTGIKLDIYLTKDNVLVALNLNEVTLPKSMMPITECPYSLLKNYNIGSKVKNQYVLTLEEILKTYQYGNRLLILNLPDHQSKNALLVNFLSHLLSKYRSHNIYIKSCNEEILSYLKASKLPNKIGLVMNNDNHNLWHQDYNFYVIDCHLVSLEMIKDKLQQGKEVMTKLIQTKDQLTKYCDKYGDDIINEIFIITSNPQQLYKSYAQINK